MSQAQRHNPVSDSSAKWASLTWDDLEAWAGSRSVSRGRSYQDQGRVEDLAVSKDGRLLATVTGGDKYVASVWLSGKEDGRLNSKCTCPVGFSGCKHAVAAVAEYLDNLGRNEEVPVAEADDARWSELDGENRDEQLDEDEIGDETEAPTPAVPKRRTRDDWDEKIKQHVFARSREDLADLVWSLTQRFPELREELRERIALGDGDVERLVAQARRELQRVTSKDPWRDGWSGQGDIPDYSNLLHRLERLVEMGHADAVVPLGHELIERGIEQVGRSNDEGDTSQELATCLPVLFNAVTKSSLPPAEKLLFAIDAHLQDDYGIIGDEADAILNQKCARSVWSSVADELARRLTASAPNRRKSDEEKDDYSRDYHRDQITNWLGRALENAGRGEEVRAIYEWEARLTGSYERLVTHLIEIKRYADAERWATEGIAKTAAKLPGIATDLAKQLCELAESRRQWEIVAAHAAYRFFERPATESFARLVASAGKSGCEEPVRRFAQHFLETGVSPIGAATTKKGEPKIEIAADWPLPTPDYLTPLLATENRFRQSQQPHYDVLIDLAIADQRLADVLHWHDEMRARRKQLPYADAWGGLDNYADRVAEAVAKSHPQRSLEIYSQRVEQNLTHASEKAYERVAFYLRKMRPILTSLKRERDWKKLVEEIRVRYRNRPKFMEVLDRLESKPIVALRKSRR